MIFEFIVDSPVNKLPCHIVEYGKSEMNTFVISIVYNHMHAHYKEAACSLINLEFLRI